MPLTDLASAIILSKLAEGWNFMSDDLEAQPDGWDTLNVTLMKDYGATPRTSNQVAAEWPTGRRVFAGRDFWVASRKPDNAGANVWQIVLTCLGLNESDRPVKVSINGTSEVHTFPGVTAIGPPLWPYTGTTAKGDVLEAQPSFALSYVQIGSRPDMARVGLAVADSVITAMLGWTLAVRPSVWTTLASPTIHLPFGWTLNDMPADVLGGTDTPVALVTENWIYRRQVSP